MSGGTYSATLENVDGGLYTLAVIDRSKPDSLCFVSSTFNLLEDTKVISASKADGDVVKGDNNNCAGTPNGYITVKTVQEDGVPTAINGNYSINWPAYVAAAGTIGTAGAVASR